MRVLVINAGSSSMKIRLVEEGAVVAGADLEAAEGHVSPGELASALADSGEADVIGHRVVHGGAVFTTPVRIDAKVTQALRELIPLAPLHQPPALAAIDLVAEARPGHAAVACFDTGYFAGLPPAAATFALPPEWRARFGLRRYGFHGLSHGYIARRVPEYLGTRHRTRRLVSCHLGSGASVAAILDGLGVDTTMGFTPLDGLVMATRSGSVDPGLLTYLLREGISFGELDDGLERRSGLLGLCGTGDMASVVAKTGSGEPAARLALDVYVHRLVASIAGMAAALGGLDVLSFTGGVGEHSPEVRAEVAGRLEWLGVAIDQGANRGAPGGDTDLSAAGAPVRTLVLTAHEDLEIARLVEDCVGGRVAVRR
jgi:acetate kinase